MKGSEQKKKKEKERKEKNGWKAGGLPRRNRIIW